jgi:cold shock CspA family protein
MPTGTIKWIHDGVGAIEPDDGWKDDGWKRVFFLVSNSIASGLIDLKAGQSLSYDLSEELAVNIARVNSPTPGTVARSAMAVVVPLFRPGEVNFPMLRSRNEIRTEDARMRAHTTATVVRSQRAIQASFHALPWWLDALFRCPLP